MRILAAIGASALLVTTAPAAAQSSGVWRVSGAISGRTFVLDCRLQPSGGVCTDTAKNGRSHPLASFVEAGDRARWGFTTKVLIASIAMTFEGQVSGDRMSGTVRAAGRTGSFTATRSLAR
jgi:hypothetical protein